MAWNLSKWALAATLAACAMAPISAQPQNLKAPRAERLVLAQDDVLASDLLIRYNSPVFSFRWSLPPEAALEPAFAAHMRSLGLTLRDEQIEDNEAAAKEEKRDREGSGAPFMPHSFEEIWSASAEGDMVLSLKGERSWYTGGAHGGFAFNAAMWDRGLGKAIRFQDMLASPKLNEQFIKSFCEQLDSERSSRRGGAKTTFSDCLDPLNYPIILTGTGPDYNIVVLIPPYEAGPWAEGSYEIVMDGALVRDQVKPRYQTLFAKKP